MEKLVIASKNKGKILEIKEILQDKFEIVSLTDINFCQEIDECGKSFLENAAIKAQTVVDFCQIATLSDDSGLCVDALNGEPGVRSARFAGENATDEENNQKLLDLMQGKSDRNAKFACSVVLIFPDGRKIDGYGEVAGKILTEKCGNGGFGYDCLFFSNELQKSFANASVSEKNKLSHRARAIEDLVKKL